jgi:hypothetical protein
MGAFMYSFRGHSEMGTSIYLMSAFLEAKIRVVARESQSYSSGGHTTRQSPGLVLRA